jgi:PAS domain S-box-containing protein
MYIALPGSPKPMTFPETTKAIKPSKLPFKSQGNECATLIEAIDWSKTSLGLMENWPISLRLTLSTILNSKIPMALFWGKEHIFFYNDAAQFRSQGKHPFALGKRAVDIFEEQWLIYKPLVDRVLEHGETTWHEDQPIPISLNDGKVEIVYSTYSYSPVYDENGKRVAVLFAGIDATEKVSNFKKLEESDRNFRNLVDQAPIGIAILYGRDFRFELVNEYYLNLIGNSNVVGRPIVDVVTNLKDGSINQLLSHVRETGVAYHGKQSHVQMLFDGIEINRYTNFVYEPLRELDGTVDRILVLVTDVSEQVHSIQKAQDAEKELRQMASAMPQLVWMAAPDGITTYFSDRIAEFSGATRRADGTWRWEGMIHPEDLDGTVSQWQNALTNETLYEKEHRLMMLDGTYKWHISRAHPFKNEGKIVKWFGTATDIDDQKKLSENLEWRVSERTRELQSSNNELAQFAYVASHDLQEPLRKIITFIELLQRDLPTMEGKPNGYLKKIEQSAQRMSTLIKDILNFSQLGKPGNRFEQTDLNEALSTIAVDLEVVIQQKNATITHETLPVLEAIPQQMNQLFYNLLSNSLKFAREGVAPIVRITSRELQRKEALKYPELTPSLNYLMIQFEDNGIGFNQKFADQIFTIFQRLNNRQDYSGTGIGLALCKKIALNHNGTIRASSTENKGSVFQVILPGRQKVESEKLKASFR